MTRVISGLVFLFLFAADAKSLRGDEQSDLEKQAVAWEYTPPKEHQTFQGGRLYVSRAWTKDDLTKVVEFYNKKLTNKALSIGKGDASVAGDKEKGTGTVDDSRQLDADGAPARPVTIAVATEYTKSYSVTVVISRAKGEDYTHIVVSFVSK
jgi:hypothetical protein